MLRRFEIGEVVKRKSLNDIIYYMENNNDKSKYYYNVFWEDIYGLSFNRINNLPNILTIEDCKYISIGNYYFYKFKETDVALYDCMLDKINNFMIELE